MALSPSEWRILRELAELTAAEDPDYVQRLATFGGHEPGEAVLPDRGRGLVPVVAAGALVVLGFAATAVAVAAFEAAGGRRRASSGRFRR
ncbi:hypothetical protein Acsp04_40960 [Actinomadura sp. NBRC 104425]|uniref:DUF3040 domain-containing protein n=1 Tax=Actinomadura sp. NBRC 104425 TaxID=3032204 RepID=UPI0024A1DC2D|nr:DUF3040 domain-containing protein [Actinomadura sp. NBRC 104425]GLZ13861.1 hypothetical protein Acsp04_40960 [Actinomadura sp. NBRC 104425]